MAEVAVVFKIQQRICLAGDEDVCIRQQAGNGAGRRPDAGSLRRKIEGGSESIMALDPEMFAVA